MTLFDPDDFASPALSETTAHLRAVTEVSTNDLVETRKIAHMPVER